MSRVLSERFSSYLQTGGVDAQDGFADELALAGFTVEAVLLRAWRVGQRVHVLDDWPWSGARVAIGTTPPQTPIPNDLWFDICELTLMVFVARSWLATRSVARWQMAGCLDAAQWIPREVQVPPPYRALDRARLLGGDMLGPCTDVTPGEATLYAWWFGKDKPHIYDWRCAAQHLPARVARSLWGASTKEWIAGQIDIDEGARAFVTPSTIDWDPDELAETEHELPAHERRMIRGEFTHEPDIGFRTSVHVQGGLHRRVTAWSLLPEDVRFVSLLDRSLFRALRPPGEPLKELFAYTFESKLGIQDMYARLTALGRWRWQERDNDAWGDYISASPLPTARHAQIKILVAPDVPERFALSVRLESDDPGARLQFDEVRRVLLHDVLPAIGADELAEVDTYE